MRLSSQVVDLLGLVRVRKLNIIQLGYVSADELVIVRVFANK